MRNWAYIKQWFTAVNSWGRAGVTGLTQRVVVKENRKKVKRKSRESRKKVNLMKRFYESTRRVPGWLLVTGALLLLLGACTQTSPQNPGADQATAAPVAAATGGQPQPAAAATPTNVPAVKSVGDPAAVTEGQTAEGDWFRGDPNAPVTLVEFSDYQCPFCSRHVSQTAPLIEDQYVKKGLVKHVFKDFPLNSIHPQAAKAAEAAQCAGAQQQFWAMHDKLFALQQAWSGKTEAPEIFKEYAVDLGLDSAAFNECLDSGQFAAEVAKDLQEGAQSGVTGTPAFFINAWFVSGAQSFEVFQQTISKAQSGQLPAPTPTPLPQGVDPFAPDPAHPGLTYSGYHYRGNSAAPILIIEFSDFQCPYCLQHYQQAEPEIDTNWVDKDLVRMVFVHFPLPIHPQAPKAAEASECAATQGKFWEMHDVLFSKQALWSGKSNATEIFKTYAQDLGLDAGKFNECLDSGQMEAKVQDGLDLGQQAQVRGTPNFFLIKDGQGTRIPGALPYEQFDQALTEILTGAQQGPQTAPTVTQ